MMKSTIVNNLPIPHINAVVGIAFTLTNKMGANFESVLGDTQLRQSRAAINK